MAGRIWIMLLIALVPYTGHAQDTSAKHPRHPQAHKRTKASQLPEWAAAHNYDAKAHVYFPDYYTFYDPVCGGYLYWDNNNYTFSKTVPSFMENADLKKTRVQILKGVSLDLYPELNYPYYMKMYPAEGHNPVPVPVPGNPAH